jgi:putative endonuclease
VSVSVNSWYVYILVCQDDSLYTGATTDVIKRLRAHNLGQGAKYTRSRLPVALVYQEGPYTRPGALRREAAIKRLSRKEKLLLVAEPHGTD